MSITERERIKERKDQVDALKNRTADEWEKLFRKIPDKVLRSQITTLVAWDFLFVDEGQKSRLTEPMIDRVYDCLPTYKLAESEIQRALEFVGYPPDKAALRAVRPDGTMDNRGGQRNAGKYGAKQRASRALKRRTDAKRANVKTYVLAGVEAI